MNLESGLQLSDLRGIARRRGRVVLLVALVTALAAYWVAMALPNEYESYATVLVEPQSVDPGLVEAGVPQSDLNRRLHLMAAQILSRPRLSRAIDELGLYQEESKYLLREEIINLMRDQIRVEPVIPEMEQGQAVLRNDFEIDQFQIFFRDDDPVVARDVAQRLANDFIQEHIANRVKISQKSLEFVEGELQRLAEEIRRTESQIASVKASNAGRLPEDVPANQRLIERLTLDLSAARREAAAARSDEAFFRSQSATAAELIGKGTEGVDSPEGRARSLELALNDMIARGYTEKHPDVIKARVELESLRAQLAGGEGRPSGSFAQQSAQAEAERARLRREHAEDEARQIEARIAEVNLLFAATPAVAEQLDALDREYRHLFQSFQDFSNRRLEAGVQADLERRQLGEQFRVLEAAFLAPEPSSPNRPIIIVIGAVFGLAVGFAMGIVLEAADASVHTPRQLQSALQIPVLASIPEILLEADRRLLRRRRLITAAAAVALCVFALIGGAINYWWVNGGERPTQQAAGNPPAATAPVAAPGA